MHGTLFCQSVKYKFLFSYISRPKLNQCLQIVPTSSNKNQNSASCVVTASQYRLFAVFPKAACEVQPAFSSPASTIAETEHRSSHERKRHFLSRGCQLAGPASVDCAGRKAVYWLLVLSVIPRTWIPRFTPTHIHHLRWRRHEAEDIIFVHLRALCLK